MSNDGMLKGLSKDWRIRFARTLIASLEDFRLEWTCPDWIEESLRTPENLSDYDTFQILNFLLNECQDWIAWPFDPD